ncbi:hypothetical protein C5613_16060 [Rhodococcus opacus]|uniref:Uncharacterized protein n=1 Tax=Rhodococcus opacus TaxID=37919 RepID=A0A2S8J9Z0_RHOOP|nr:hypothetical protein C5613_16060 [Rhodococcus opacus]
MQTIATSSPPGITAPNRPVDPVGRPVRSLRRPSAGNDEVLQPGAGWAADAVDSHLGRRRAPRTAPAGVTAPDLHRVTPPHIHVCPSRPAADQAPFDPPRSEPKERP